MSFVIPCPNCGPRDAAEFRYGGEIADGPANQPRVQAERWLHRFGCGRWLRVERDVRINVVHRAEWLAPIARDGTDR